MFTSEVIQSFNELESSIYNYVINHLDKVAYMRIRELAEKTHVSTSTILRFCKKVGCEGFSEFKTKLKIEQETNQKSVKTSHSAVLEFFERNVTADQEQLILKAAQLVNNADNIIFIGNGSSGILAEYGARYFSGLGKFSLYIKDSSYPIHSKLETNSVTIALSVSGESHVTINQLNELKQKGSKVISITNNKQTTIGKMSDLNIAYYLTEEHHQYTNITSQVPVIFIIEAIARELHQLDH